MRTFASLSLLVLSLLIARPAAAQNLISTGASSGLRLYMTNGNDFWLDPTNGSALIFKVNGNAVSTMTAEGFWLINGMSAISNNGITATSFTATATGNAQYAIRAASGVLVNAGGVTAPFFDGAHVGDGSRLTGLPATGEGNTYSSTKTFTGAVGIGAAGLSNGTLVVQSTSTTAGNPVIAAKNNAGSELMRVEQGGNVKIGSGNGDGGAGSANLNVSGIVMGGVSGQGYPFTVLNARTGAPTTVNPGWLSGWYLEAAQAIYGPGTTIDSTQITSVRPVTLSDRLAVGGVVVAQSTLTVQGDAFSVGASTLVVSSGRLGVGTSSPAERLDVSGGAQFGSGALKSTFTATPSATAYALQLSSGLNVLNAGGVNAAFFEGMHKGDGSRLTGVTAATAGSLSADPADCAAGNAPLGVTASGAAFGCFDVGTQAEVDGKVSKAGDSMTGTLSLTNATSNLIQYNAVGVGPPAFTSRSVGAKLVLWPQIGAADADYGFGIDSGVLWSGVPTTAQLFRWYGGTTLAASLTGAGNASFTGGVTAASFTGPVSGNATTATALAANPADCAAGNAPLGVAANGTAEGCYDVATQPELNTHGALTGSSAHGATNLNTAGAIVARDASGNFSATAVLVNNDQAEPRYQTTIYGANGDLPFRLTATTPLTMRYVYGPLSYAMPACASGNRWLRTYAEFVDNITTGGQVVMLRIAFDGGVNVDFNLSSTWGGSPSYRTFLSAPWQSANTSHASIQAWVSGVAGPYAEIRKAEIWMYCTN